MKARVQLKKDEIGRKFHILKVDKEYFENFQFDDGIDCCICGQPLGTPENCIFYFCSERHRTICYDCEHKKFKIEIDNIEHETGVITCDLQRKKDMHTHHLIKKIVVVQKK